jgi:hypothetical protein
MENNRLDISTRVFIISVLFCLNFFLLLFYLFILYLYFNFSIFILEAYPCAPGNLSTVRGSWAALINSILDINTF